MPTSDIARSDNRGPRDLRPVKITRPFTKYAEGSVLIEMGETKVVCTASVEEKVPAFLRDKGQGWITAEYGMLPRSTHDRMSREASKGKQGGRTLEIQRLVGRVLRAVTDMQQMGARTVWIDCDVIQADGGTRTTSISGGFVALYDALQKMVTSGALKSNPITHFIAAVSVGMYQQTPVLDLDYAEDCSAETDMNIVMNDAESFIEIQGTAEQEAFTHDELMQLLSIGRHGIKEIIQHQKDCLAI